tara:strand:+ start:667 stop:819 length:153 start_codon:yes stop_codon:yes gene_type:complete
MKEYQIIITPLNAKGASYILVIESDRIEWSMEQYQRNRDAFDWKIKEVNE